MKSEDLNSELQCCENLKPHNKSNSLGCEILIAVSCQIGTFWVVIPCHHVHSYHVTVWRPKQDDNLKAVFCKLQFVTVFLHSSNFQHSINL